MVFSVIENGQVQGKEIYSEVLKENGETLYEVKCYLSDENEEPYCMVTFSSVPNTVVKVEKLKEEPSIYKLGTTDKISSDSIAAFLLNRFNTESSLSKFVAEAIRIRMAHVDWDLRAFNNKTQLPYYAEIDFIK